MPNKRIIQVVIILALGIVVFRFFLTTSRIRFVGKQPFLIRVRVAHNASKLKLTAGGKYEVRNAETQGLLEKRVVIEKGIEILPAERGIKFGKKIFPVKAIRISPFRKKSLGLGGTLYRGQMDIIKTRKGLDAVNRVELEDYLKGVVPREMNCFWPFEAIKAQAIASRSFAAYQAMHRKNKDYDLKADTSSQVYGGQSSERRRTTKAVEATKDKVLEYEGKILPAYFHSCCGGHTESAARMWAEELEPLKGVRCPWCRWSPHFRWQVRVPTQTILDKLNDKGYYIKKIDDIKPGTRDASRRLEYVRVKSRNKWFEITIEEFRSAIGRKTLKSANFRVKKYPLFYIFSGYGWGHGVGMCQGGAFGLALRRWSAEKILEYYYPGAKIRSLTEVLR